MKDLTDNGEIRPDIVDVFTRLCPDPTSTAIPREKSENEHTSSANAPEIDSELVAFKLELHTVKAENQKAILRRQIEEERKRRKEPISSSPSENPVNGGE
ncbi:hypothetical protein SNE40_015381 [Patella caerulea]|uniref:Uncharacterized protein n=1 Tax=Patella caerulea TaxID=87958 RepID=A0AAN8JL08_PATCE